MPLWALLFYVLTLSKMQMRKGSIQEKFGFYRALFCQHTSVLQLDFPAGFLWSSCSIAFCHYSKCIEFSEKEKQEVVILTAGLSVGKQALQKCKQKLSVAIIDCFGKVFFSNSASNRLWSIFAQRLFPTQLLPNEISWPPRPNWFR